MTLAVRQQTVVDQNHAIHLQSPEFKPGSKVGVIVLMEKALQGVQTVLCLHTRNELHAKCWGFFVTANLRN